MVLRQIQKVHIQKNLKIGQIQKILLYGYAGDIW